MDPIRSIGPLRENGPLQKSGGVNAGDKAGPSFRDTFKTFMTDVNEMQVKASESIQKLAAGEITDVHQVMSAAEEANVAFNMMMELRNKVMEAYQEVMRIRI